MQAWETARLADAQVRTGYRDGEAMLIGFDMVAALAIADAVGLDKRIGVELLAAIERGMREASRGEAPDASDDDEEGADHG